MSVAFPQAVPILRIFSVEKARVFYLDFLGFTWDWEHRFGEDFPLYAQVSRAGLALHLSEHYRYYRPGIEEAEWGARIMKVQDPFHNRLTFAERK